MSGTYTTISALRGEGINDPPYSDALLTSRIGLASRLIDMYTRRCFAPVAKTLTLDGRDTPRLRLPEPIIAVTAVTVQHGTGTPDTIDLADLKIYNRHVTQNLTAPDDRNDPKIAFLLTDFGPLRHQDFLPSRVFPKGRQNVTVTGTFGYTDYDGTSNGRTPVLIEHACTLLVVRHLPAKIAGADSKSNIKREKTKEQDVEFGDPSKVAIQGAFTGDPEIDMILAMYRRPAALGAA